jgi:5-methylthioadenosine/S-adenosylhomocysteine deaminase
MSTDRTCDTLIHARWIIPVDAADTVLQNHCVAIRKGRILSIEPSIGCDWEARETVTLEHHALLPGFVNTHCHASMSLFRGMADDLPLMEWLGNHIWPAEAKWVAEGFVRDGALLAMAEMIRGGITCFSDMYFFPNVVAHAAHEAQMRAQLACPILDFPSAWASNADEYIHKALALHDDFRHQDRIRIALGPHAPYTVSDAPLGRVVALAEEADLAIQMHIHETAFEVADALEKTGERPLARLHRLGLLGPRLQAVHMTQLTDDEIRLLAESNVSVLHCPESNLKLASGFCPVAALIAAGVNVALGTDGAASNNDLDLFGEMRTAALLAKGVSGNPAAVPAQTALRMATINGARALGIDDLCGSLETGKSADMIAVDMSGLEMEPAFHPVSQLVYATGRQQVTDVWVEGRDLMRQRVLQTLDESAILASVRQWLPRLRGEQP